ncbi:MAG: helix-turn-helix domain-containing protein [Lachnospiraceae bacterium]|nr:helix-turn-helix domain-containing protein [Lachnospiraceae bacterium]
MGIEQAINNYIQEIGEVTDDEIEVIPVRDPETLDEELKAVAEGEEPVICKGDECILKLPENEPAEYIIRVRGTDAHKTGIIVRAYIRSISSVNRSRLDKGRFWRDYLTGAIDHGEALYRARKLHISDEQDRMVYLIEAHNDTDNILEELLKSLYTTQMGYYITEPVDGNIILLRELKRSASKEEIYTLAENIVDLSNTEAMLDVRVAFGQVAGDLKNLPLSYQEARATLEIGEVFYNERKILSFDGLGIGRLIYKLPREVCLKFTEDVFGIDGSREPDEELMLTVYRFFDNNLNISETSRQLYIHRNTLVNRLEKVRQLTGLDVRVFEDALTFKLARMASDYTDYLNGNKLKPVVK